MTVLTTFCELCIFVALIFCIGCTDNSASAPNTFENRVRSTGDVHVDAHTRNGTYIPEHARTQPDHLRSNNFSQPGNVNPWEKEQQANAKKETLKAIDPFLNEFDAAQKRGMSDQDAYEHARNKTGIDLKFD